MGEFLINVKLHPPETSRRLYDSLPLFPQISLMVWMGRLYYAIISNCRCKTGKVTPDTSSKVSNTINKLKLGNGFHWLQTFSGVFLLETLYIGRLKIKVSTAFHSKDYFSELFLLSLFLTLEGVFFTPRQLIFKFFLVERYHVPRLSSKYALFEFKQVWIIIWKLRSKKMEKSYFQIFYEFGKMKSILKVSGDF